jgi:hypothetical protein
MDWPFAITRQRTALIAIIVALMKSVGLVDGGVLTTLPFYLYRKALAIIRPAEAAVRRLIMMAAYDMELRGVKLRQALPIVGRHRTAFPNATNFAPSFNLIDPLKPYAPDGPDYSLFGQSFDESTARQITTRLNAASLGRRLLALKNALDNVQKQARRLTRWYALRDAAHKQNKPHRMSPLRPGFPPGYRKKPIHPVEEVLLDCHSFAQYARERRDSS